MDIKWLQKQNYQIPFNKLLTSFVCLLVPESSKLVKPKLIDFFKSKKFIVDFNLQKEFSYNDLVEMYMLLKKVPFDSFLEKILYLLRIKESSWSFYYLKVKLDKISIPEFIYTSYNYVYMEPKEIKETKKTDILLIEYFYAEKFNLIKNIKIQETFENFKLNSIYAEDEKQKAFGIVKIKDAWFIYDDTKGLYPIKFKINNNVITFLDTKNFSFSKMKNCTLIYLKFKQFEEKIINPYKECNCKTDFGWRQADPYCLSTGICWYDAGMMCFLIPLKSRKIFLSPISKKYNLSEATLYPCAESNASHVKVAHVKKHFNIDATKTGGNILPFMEKIFPLISKNIELTPNTDLMKNNYSSSWWTHSPNLPLYSSSKQLKIIPEDFIPLTKIFILSIQVSKSKIEKIRSTYKGYELISIFIGFLLKGGGHAIAFIKCNDGWYLYDDNLAQDGQNMIPIKTIEKNGFIEFKPVTYRYSLNSYDIYMDLKKTPEDFNLIYCL